MHATCYFCRKPKSGMRLVRLRAGRIKHRGRKKEGYTTTTFAACSPCRDERQGEYQYAR